LEVQLILPLQEEVVPVAKGTIQILVLVDAECSTVVGMFAPEGPSPGKARHVPENNPHAFPMLMSGFEGKPDLTLWFDDGPQDLAKLALQNLTHYFYSSHYLLSYHSQSH
jgi:hypothetical protein